MEFSQLVAARKRIASILESGQLPVNNPNTEGELARAYEILARAYEILHRLTVPSPADAKSLKRIDSNEDARKTINKIIGVLREENYSVESSQIILRATAKILPQYVSVGEIPDDGEFNIGQLA